MSAIKNGLVYEGIVNGFNCAKWLLKQRPHLKGAENLRKLPNQVIFTVTHDSYFEIPSLANVYKAIDPRPVFTVMAKEDFLSGRYLSSNFFKESLILRHLLRLIDSTGAPKAVFEKLNLISIPRPFADAQHPAAGNVKHQISSQFNQFRSKISDGFSTLIFPEGTTWGYGGLRKIRSAVFQLVSTSYEEFGKKIYMVPINVKVDRLVSGWKDVFINIGTPEFFLKEKEAFNHHLYSLLLRLHTITFSQVAAYYLRRLAGKGEQSGTEIPICKSQLFERLDNAANELHRRVKEGLLPNIDQRLTDAPYLTGKIDRLFQYGVKHQFFVRTPKDSSCYRLNGEKILSHFPKKVFRKKNPVAFHANEFASLGSHIQILSLDP